MKVFGLRRARAGAVAIVPAAALVLAGCTSTLNTSKIQDTLKKQIQSQGATVDSVSCPSSPTAKKGNTFTCDVAFTTSDGTKHTGTVTVEQLDNNGHVSISPFQEGGAGNAGTGTETTGTGNTGSGSSGSGTGTTTT